MRARDPFERWLIALEYSDGRGFGPELRSSLDQLEKELKRARMTKKKPKYGSLYLQTYGFTSVRSEELQRVQRLYFRVVEQGGAGNQSLQESLLDLIGGAANPASIPFWNELLGLQRKRDRFSEKRRRFALAALALLLVRGEDEALEPMVEALELDHPDTRAAAAENLRRAYLIDERNPPDEVVERLTSVSTEDKALSARFTARMALQQLGLSCPPVLPGGAYAFKVWLSWSSDVYRVIELRSEHDLDCLAGAILDAFDWDHDHLYSFFVNGKLWDERYEVSHPDSDGSAFLADELSLGELVLSKGDKLLFLFDYGDNHEFMVRVTNVRSDAGDDVFPRVIKAVGDAPEQYPSW